MLTAPLNQIIRIASEMNIKLIISKISENNDGDLDIELQVKGANRSETYNLEIWAIGNTWNLTPRDRSKPLRLSDEGVRCEFSHL